MSNDLRSILRFLKQMHYSQYHISSYKKISLSPHNTEIHLPHSFFQWPKHQLMLFSCTWQCCFNVKLHICLNDFQLCTANPPPPSSYHPSIFCAYHCVHTQIDSWTHMCNMYLQCICMRNMIKSCSSPPVALFSIRGLLLSIDVCFVPLSFSHMD